MSGQIYMWMLSNVGANSEVFDSLSVIIEVKGCWNSELENSMKTQLVDRYPKNNRCQHGLYLVGWFNCNQWDDSDYRKGKSPESDRAELQKQFDTQAADISQQGVQIRAFVMNAALRVEKWNGNPGGWLRDNL